MNTPVTTPRALPVGEHTQEMILGVPVQKCEGWTVAKEISGPISGNAREQYRQRVNDCFGIAVGYAVGISKAVVGRKAALIARAPEMARQLAEQAERIAQLEGALEAYQTWHHGKNGSLSSSENLRKADTLARAALAGKAGK